MFVSITGVQDGPHNHQNMDQTRDPKNGLSTKTRRDAEVVPGRFQGVLRCRSRTEEVVFGVQNVQ